ncbi:MAG: WD40 repeat domain-containing protein [Chloroflexota bacterium]
MKLKHMVERGLLASASILLSIFIALSPVKAQTQPPPSNSVSAVAWSPDSSKLAVALFDYTIQIWDVETKQVFTTLKGHTKWISSVGWSPDGNKLVSGSDDNAVRIWDAQNGQLLNTLEGHNETVFAVAWSPDGKKIASMGSEATRLRIWDADTGKFLAAYDVGNTTQLVWSPDGHQLAVPYSYSDIVGVLSTTTFEMLALLGIDHDSLGMAVVAWSADSNRLISGSRDGVVRIWDVASGKSIATFRGSDVKPQEREDRTARSVAFSADGLKALSANADGTIRTWDIATGKTLATIQQPTLGTIFAASWSVYGNRLVLGGTGDGKAQSVTNSSLQIIVPFPSLEDLQATVKQCAATAVKSNLATLLDGKQLQQFVTAVKALTSDQIPPACAADLIAVAEALQAKP